MFKTFIEQYFKEDFKKKLIIISQIYREQILQKINYFIIFFVPYLNLM